MKILPQVLLLIMLTGCTVPNHFPTENFKGQVIDSETEKPVKGALVLIKSTSTAFFAIHNHLIGFSYTDETGHYEINSDSEFRLVASTDPTPVKAVIVIQKNYKHYRGIIYDEKGSYTKNVFLRKCEKDKHCSEKPRGHFTGKAKQLMEEQLKN